MKGMTLRELFQRIEQKNPEMLDSEQFVILAKGSKDGKKTGTLVTLNADAENFISLQRDAFATFYNTVKENEEMGEDAEVFAQSAMVTALSYIAKRVVREMDEGSPIANSMFFTVLKDVTEHNEFLLPEYFFIAGGVDGGCNAMGASMLSPTEIMAGALGAFEKMVKDELCEKDAIVEMLELSAKAFNELV